MTAAGETSARITRVLDPAFVEGLTDQPIDELRHRRDEALAEREYQSYLRRLVQVRDAGSRHLQLPRHLQRGRQLRAHHHPRGLWHTWRDVRRRPPTGHPGHAGLDQQRHRGPGHGGNGHGHRGPRDPRPDPNRHGHLHPRRPQPERHLHGSIGIGYGDTLVIGDEDLFGSEMNVACKLGEDIAGLDEILITTAAYTALPANRYLCRPVRFALGELEIHCYRYEQTLFA